MKVSQSYSLKAVPHGFDSPIRLDLPETLLNQLVLSSSGKMHLLQLAHMASACMAQAQGSQVKSLLELSLAFFLAAWEADPFDGKLAQRILALNERLPYLERPLALALGRVAQSWRLPPRLEEVQRLAGVGDYFGLRRHIEERLVREGHNLFWWQYLLALTVAEGDYQWAAAWMESDAPAGMEPVFQMVLGDLCLGLGDPGKAASCYDLARPLHSLPDFPFRRAECEMELSGLDKALPLMRSALARHSWQVNRLLRLHDLLIHRHKAESPLPGRVALLLYSYNKGEELDATLASLYRSHLPDCRIFVLNNGSTDGTGALLPKWRDLFGGERLAIIDLPVNVGAPAARNWLMSLEEVQSCPFVVFMDDDVELPPRWLGFLGEARRVYPGAGVWGCQVLEHQYPSRIQSLDFHLATKEGRSNGMASHPVEHFEIPAFHHQVLNCRQFDYLRPCASVTGCCHLFETPTLLESGFFDLGFSPSQFDDLDHDLRLALAGKPAVYQGHLKIPHKKRTGALNQKKYVPAVEANLFLLQKKHPPEEIQQIIQWERRLLLADLLEKLETVNHLAL